VDIVSRSEWGRDCGIAKNRFRSRITAEVVGKKQAKCNRISTYIPTRVCHLSWVLIECSAYQQTILPKTFTRHRTAIHELCILLTFDEDRRHSTPLLTAGRHTTDIGHSRGRTALAFGHDVGDVSSVGPTTSVANLSSNTQTCLII
jgi:hypothetical protein